MPDCTSIDPLITPYVDGDIGAPERRLVDEHVRRCPPCYSRVSAERAVFELMKTRRRRARRGHRVAGAARSLRGAAVAVVGRGGGGGAAKAWRARLVPLAVAAGVVRRRRRGVDVRADGALVARCWRRSSRPIT